MCTDRRAFLKFSALSALTLGFESTNIAASQNSSVQKMAGEAKPIAPGEYSQRQQNAQRYMHEAGLDAIVLTGGPSLRYLTGADWGISERLFALVLRPMASWAGSRPHLKKTAPWSKSSSGPT